MNFLTRYLTCGILFTFVMPSLVHPQSLDISDVWNTAEARQFDFWIGEWDVNLRMIQPDKTWRDSVKAKVKIYPILDGKAILELWDSEPIKGFSLRYYDPAKKKWVLYLNWPSNSRSSIGSLEGQFRHGRGEFFSSSKGTDGKETLSRYTFCDITENSLRWDDAFSKDGGKTWTNNWIMEFTRTAKMPSWPDSENAHTFVSGNRCKGPEFDLINSMAGLWTGKISIDENKKELVDATLNVFRILDGCTIIRFLEFEMGEQTYRNFGLISYNRQTKQFEELRLDNRPGLTAQILRGINENKNGLSKNGLSLSVAEKSDNIKRILKHHWTIPTSENEKLIIASSSSTDDGKNWTTSVNGTFTKSQKETVGLSASDRKSPGESDLENGLYLVNRWTETKGDLFPLLDDERYFKYDENKFFQLKDEAVEPIRHIGLSKTEFIPFDLKKKPQPIPQDDGRVQIDLKFSKKMASKLTPFSRKYLGRQVAMVIGGEIITLHKVRSVISSDGIQISRCTDDGCQLIMSKFGD